MKVDCSVADSMMRDQRFIALKVKDAVVDQFRDKFGVRPDVAVENPDLRIIVKVIKNEFHVSIDTSGESLFMRGYRREAGPAPLKENLAAGLVRLSEWDRQSPIVDPTCGSGTILIEAAMLALNMAPGASRKSFGFQKLLAFKTEEQQEAWSRVLQEAIDQEKAELDFKLYGYDIDREALRAAKRNAFSAGVDHVIEFGYGNITTLVPPVEKGLFISNPPYGARLGDEYQLRDVYKDMGHTLKTNFKGWDAWILSGNKDLIGDLKLKSTRKHFVFTGPLECRFLKYSMY
jgi:putative N6-adenine-specific DNA methylase